MKGLGKRGFYGLRENFDFPPRGKIYLKPFFLPQKMLWEGGSLKSLDFPRKFLWKVPGLPRTSPEVPLELLSLWILEEIWICETFFPLQHSKNAPNPKFVQNLSQQLFWGVLVRGSKICKKLSEFVRRLRFFQIC